MEPPMSVTPDDVTNAYRWLLGREPDEKGLTAWLGTDSRDDLRRAFMVSPEFRRTASELPPLPSAGPLPRLRTANEIQWQADAATEAALAAHIQRTWTRLGEEKPHWSVISADRFLPENICEYRTLFYESGAHEVDLIMNILQGNGIDAASIRSVVEYGCGVGRVTPHLAAKFPRVAAIDISDSHLVMARQACAGRPGIGFKIARMPEFGMAEPFDLWFSYIVLQHNPPPIIARILTRAFTMLARGGVAIFQVPTWCNNYRFQIADYLASRPADATIEVHCLPQHVIFQLAHQAGCIPLEVREDSAMDPPAWESHVFAFRKIGG